MKIRQIIWFFCLLSLTWAEDCISAADISGNTGEFKLTHSCLKLNNDSWATGDTIKAELVLEWKHPSCADFELQTQKVNGVNGLKYAQSGFNLKVNEENCRLQQNFSWVASKEAQGKFSGFDLQLVYHDFRIPIHFEPIDWQVSKPWNKLYLLFILLIIPVGFFVRKLNSKKTADDPEFEERLSALEKGLGKSAGSNIWLRDLHFLVRDYLKWKSPESADKDSVQLIQAWVDSLEDESSQQAWTHLKKEVEHSLYGGGRRTLAENRKTLSHLKNCIKLED